jgi:cyclophilin family peptidyl-prolyl cis-trans isomerase
VFGHVVSGEDMVEKINALPCDNIFRPLQDVKVLKSGELILRPKKKKKKRSSSSESIASEKESKKKNEKHRER